MLQTELLMEIVNDAIQTLDELAPHGRDIRLDSTIGKGIATGFEFRVTGGGDRVTKEAFEDLARSVGIVLQEWLPPRMSEHCQAWSSPEFVFFEALMTWARARGEGASSEVYYRSLYDPIRAAKGLLRLMKSELRLQQVRDQAPAMQARPKDPSVSAEPDDLISRVDAAEIVKCSEQTIRNRIKSGILKTYGPHGRVSKKEVEEKRLSLRQRSHARPAKPKRAPLVRVKQSDSKAMNVK